MQSFIYQSIIFFPFNVYLCGSSHTKRHRTQIRGKTKCRHGSNTAFVSWSDLLADRCDALLSVPSNFDKLLYVCSITNRSSMKWALIAAGSYSSVVGCALLCSGELVWFVDELLLQLWCGLKANSWVDFLPFCFSTCETNRQQACGRFCSLFCSSN